MQEPAALFTEARLQLTHAAHHTIIQERRELQKRLQADMEEHGSLGHRMTKEGLPPLTVTGDTISYLNAQRTKWQDIWTGDRARDWTLPPHLRPQPTNTADIPNHDIQGQHEFCKAYPAKMSCGADLW